MQNLKCVTPPDLRVGSAISSNVSCYGGSPLVCIKLKGIHRNIARDRRPNPEIRMLHMSNSATFLRTSPSILTAMGPDFALAASPLTSTGPGFALVAFHTLPRVLALLWLPPHSSTTLGAHTRDLTFTLPCSRDWACQFVGFPTLGAHTRDQG